MRVLVATTETQGMRASDYFWAVEGELVRLPGLTCPDTMCGCDRGWAGLSSSRATTTCQVSDLPIQRDDVIAAFVEAMTREGWVDERDGTTWVSEFAESHLDLASTLPIGTVLELRDGETVLARARPDDDASNP